MVWLYFIVTLFACMSCSLYREDRAHNHVAIVLRQAGAMSSMFVNMNGGIYTSGIAYGYDTRLRVLSAANDLLSSNMNPSFSEIARMTGVSRSFATKVLNWSAAGEPIGARAKGGVANQALEDYEHEYLAYLVVSGMCYSDIDYWATLARDIGCTASPQTVRDALIKISAVLKKTRKEPLDKYTVDNTLRLGEYIQEISGVPRARLRFYDQTGISYKDILQGRRRQLPGIEAVEYVASDFRSGVHYSTFGLTSIRPEQPPLAFKIYEATQENGQCVDEHIDFFDTCIRSGILQPNYDAIVRDGWSAHTGEFGTELEDILQDSYGIAVVPLPSRYASLNPIEFNWNVAKARTRRLRALSGTTDADMTPAFFASALSSISHATVCNTYAHCGYQIEQPALLALARAGLL